MGRHMVLGGLQSHADPRSDPGSCDGCGVSGYGRHISQQAFRLNATQLVLHV